MLRSDDDVPHPRVLCELYPCVSIELDGIELGRKTFVLAHGNLRAVHDPFTQSERAFPLPFSGRDGIQAPVNEQAILCLAEPAKPRLFGGVGRGLTGLRTTCDCDGGSRNRDKS